MTEFNVFATITCAIETETEDEARDKALNELKEQGRIPPSSIEVVEL